MSRRVWNYLNAAGKLAYEKRAEKGFVLAAIGVRSDGAVVSGVNALSMIPDRTLHAEKRCLAKIK